MIICIPFFAGDARQAASLLRWIKDLGGGLKYHCLLVADAALQWNTGLEILGHAQQAFRTAELVTTDGSVTGWPQGGNALWLRAAQHARTHNVPFLWLEPDAIPLKPSWMQDLDAAYTKAGKPFLGRLYSCDNPDLPKRLMSGIGIYPADAIERIGETAQGERAWDVAAAEMILPNAENSLLIQHFWGQPGLPPTFAEVKTPSTPINTFTLQNIRPESVIFHRNKDGTLIRLLRMRDMLTDPECPPFTIVIAACNKDALLAHKNLNWMFRLGGCPDREAVLALSSDTVPRFVEPLEKAARSCFKQVSIYKYKCSSLLSWPEGANIAFRNTCLHMQDGGAPWLWLEPDAIPLKPGWDDIVQVEYNRCGKPFFGPIVPGMGHCNGVAIYPAQAPSLIPFSISRDLPKNIAWDSAMRDEMIGLCFDASATIQHVWGLVDGKPHPMLGESPVFKTHEQVRQWVFPAAAVFHRCKDGSLIDRLTEMNP